MIKIDHLLVNLNDYVNFQSIVLCQVLPQLEQFEKIFLWFGNDVFSRQAVNQFSRKLNLNRCFLVRCVTTFSPLSGALPN